METTTNTIPVNKILGPKGWSPTPKNVGNFASIYAIFEVASTSLKFPAIRIPKNLDNPTGTTLKLYRAGAKSKQPGVVNVKDDNGVWYGRVTQDGAFDPGFVGSNDPQVLAQLTALAADPAGYLGRVGRLLNRCTFCKLTLSDARSVEVGYGQKCADNFGLPWGKAVVAA